MKSGRRIPASSNTGTNKRIRTQEKTVDTGSAAVASSSAAAAAAAAAEPPSKALFRRKFDNVPALMARSLTTCCVVGTPYLPMSGSGSLKTARFTVSSATAELEIDALVDTGCGPPLLLPPHKALELGLTRIHGKTTVRGSQRAYVLGSVTVSALSPSLTLPTAHCPSSLP